MATMYNVEFNSQNTGLQVGHVSGDVYYGATKQPDQKREVLQWISKIPYRKHHAAVLKGILPDSGKWLLQKERYQEWLSSSESSTLWLHGIPGCGKTRLVSHVIEALSRQRGFGYFYCTRDPADIKRADPDEILRSILRQLLTFEELPKDVIDLHHKNKNDAEEFDDKLAAPNIEQCIGFILESITVASLTLVIDALDECDPNKRHLLMNAFEELIHKAPSNIKIFISSRNDCDIVMRMKATPNIMISASDNSVDIKCYVDSEIDRAVQDRRLLGGVVSSELSNKIKSTLAENAQGMFQWVNLVIQNICEFHRLQLAEDILDEIVKLPAGLKELYGLTLHRIYDKGERSQTAAICILRWLLGAQVSLICVEFTGAISKITGVHLEPQGVVDLCDNLIIIDPELNVFRFAHLSVREFLESDSRFSQSSVHSSLGTECAQIYIDSAKTVQPLSTDEASRISYEQYACVYWPIHFYLSKSDAAHTQLDAILEPDQEERSKFEQWAMLVARSSERSLSEDIRFRMKLAFGSSLHPIFIAIAFELQDYVRRMAKDLDQDLKNQFNQSPLTVACTLGNHFACEILISTGANLDGLNMGPYYFPGANDLSLNPLTAAAQKQYWNITKMLISAGANLNLDYSRRGYRSILNIAVSSGLLWLVQDLVAAGAKVNSLFNYENSLSLATEGGYADICRFLLSHGIDDKWFGPSPLTLAAGKGHLEVIEILLKAGAPVEDNSSGSGTVH